MVSREEFPGPSQQGIVVVDADHDLDRPPGLVRDRVDRFEQERPAILGIGTDDNRYGLRGPRRSFGTGQRPGPGFRSPRVHDGKITQPARAGEIPRGAVGASAPWKHLLRQRGAVIRGTRRGLARHAVICFEQNRCLLRSRACGYQTQGSWQPRDPRDQSPFYGQRLVVTAHLSGIEGRPPSIDQSPRSVVYQADSDFSIALCDLEVKPQISPDDLLQGEICDLVPNG